MSWLYARQRQGNVEEFKADTSEQDLVTRSLVSSLRGASNDGTDAAGNAMVSVPFLAGSESFALMVRIPTNYPSAPPRVRLAGPQRLHPWLDDNNYVAGNPKLARWYPHYDLPQTVSEVITYFQQTLPQRAEATDDDPPPDASPVPRRESSEVYHTPMPAVPSEFAKLDEMTTAEQERLVKDEVAREALVDDLQEVKGYRQLLEDTRVANMATAKGLSEREETLLNLRDSCLILQSELREKARAHDLLAQTTTFERPQVEGQLEAELVAAEEAKEDEGLRLDDGVDVREWTEAFLAKAAQYHRLNGMREVLRGS